MAERVSAHNKGGSNLTADTFHLHLRRIEKSKAAADAASDTYKSLNGIYRNDLKDAKEDGVNIKVLLRTLKRKHGDPAQLDLDLRDEITYSAWMGVPVDPDVLAQAGVSDDVSEEDVRLRDEFDDFEDGKSAGRDGHSMTTNTDDAGTERYQTWQLGWAEGQKDNLTKGPGAATAPPAKRGRKTAEAALH